MARVLIGIVAMALLTTGLAPLGFGYWAGQRLEGLLERAQRRSGLQIRVEQADPGWLRTHVRMRIEPPGPLDAGAQTTARPRTLIARGVLEHGPIPWLSLELFRGRPATAWMSGDLQLRGADIAPLAWTGHLALNGGGELALHAEPGQAAIPERGGLLRWAQLRALLRFDEPLRRVESEMTLPRLQIEAPDGRLECSDLRWQSATRPGIADLSLGELTLRIGHLAVDGSDGGDLKVRDLVLEAATEEGGEGTVDAALELTAEALEAPALQLGRAQYAIALRRLDAAALAELGEVLRDLRSRAIPQQQAGLAMGAALLGAVPKLLKRRPVLELRELSLQSEHGELSGHGTLSVAADNIAALASPLLLRQALDAEAELRISEELLTSFLAADVREELEQAGLDFSEDQVQAMAKHRIRKRMQAPDSFFSRDGADFRMQVRLQKGQLSVNGRTIEPSELAMP